MPIQGEGWEILIRRSRTEANSATGQVRTVGTYQVYHDGVAAEGPRMSGMTAEPTGPSQNEQSATEDDPSRIRPRRYRLGTYRGGDYATAGYRDDDEIAPRMPAIQLRDVDNRTKILIHPGKQEFLSSYGCINLCTSLPDENEIIDYPGSRRRVIAVIDDIRQYVGDAFPDDEDQPIPNAWAVIEGEP